MTKREKVIRGLEWCIKLDGNGCSLECPYLAGKSPCPNAMLRDALALLKEQEARVMTEGEVLHSIGKPLWFESRGVYLGRKGFWCLLFEVDQELHIRIVQSVTGGKITLSLIDYGKTWRCWTSRPSEQQMREAKWEDKDAE